MPRTNTNSTTSRAKPTSARRTTRKSDDALAILAADHKRVQKMFKQFEKIDREDIDAMRELVEQACTEIEMHATLEEELVYPALRDAIDEEHAELVIEAHIEHDSAKQLIEQLRQLQPGDERYAPTFTVLGEYVNHHIEEEESELFKQAKKAKLDLEAIGEQLQALRAQMQDSLEGGESELDTAETDATGKQGEEAPHEIPVKDMDIEDEADMEPARGGSARSGR